MARIRHDGIEADLEAIGNIDPLGDRGQSLGPLTALIDHGELRDARGLELSEFFQIGLRGGSAGESPRHSPRPSNSLVAFILILPCVLQHFGAA